MASISLCACAEAGHFAIQFHGGAEQQNMRFEFREAEGRSEHQERRRGIHGAGLLHSRVRVRDRAIEILRFRWPWRARRLARGARLVNSSEQELAKRERLRYDRRIRAI